LPELYVSGFFYEKGGPELPARTEFYTAEEYAAAKEVNIAAFLMSIGYELTRSGSCWKGKVYCFESAIDAVSHASLVKLNGGDWRDAWRISLGGTSFLGLDRFLSEHPRIRAVVACLDNDETGNRRSEKLMSEYSAKGYYTEREASDAKDFNEDLLNDRQEMEDDLDYEQ
jgi:hypothetical protein